VSDKHHLDSVTGKSTTGHSWDGITELNTPLPRWWLWSFYICILWAVGYWVVYPTWPLVTSYSQGLFAWQSRDAVVEDLRQLKVQRGPMMDRLAAASLQEITADTKLLEFARALGKPAFGDNCAACHGAGGAGAKGYPNLNDDDWLWGGKLDDIAFTIRHGVRSSSDETRQSMMPAFGRDGILTSEQIVAVAGYVRSLTKLPTKADVTRGKKVFAENCASCHGADAKGKREFGAPNLADSIWLFGSDEQIIVETVTNGRNGVMPTWADRLDDVTQKALTVYVHTLGGGER
jgi:cytochrome c oxidase cbb3-type subunit 3